VPHLTTLSVILPVLDERDNLAELVPEIVTILGATLPEFEVIVVDDSSTDGTDHLMQELTTADNRVRYHVRSGKGRSLPASLSDGVAMARFPHVAWMDADGSMPVNALVLLVDSYRNSPEHELIVVGSRFVRGGGFKGVNEVGDTRWWTVVKNLRESNDSLAAVILSRMLNRYLWILLDRCCRDLASGFILASREVVNQVGIRGSYGDYCIRFLYGAHRLGYQLCEVPYICLVRRHGVSKTGITLAQLLKRGLPYLTTPLRVRREFASR
jgi:dolichol-phosphate mannosyltransferase